MPRIGMGERHVRLGKRHVRLRELHVRLRERHIRLRERHVLTRCRGFLTFCRTRLAFFVSHQDISPSAIATVSASSGMTGGEASFVPWREDQDREDEDTLSHEKSGWARWCACVKQSQAAVIPLRDGPCLPPFVSKYTKWIP